MQGIVLAIIISTLSPEGMNGATAALRLSAKLLGLFLEGGWDSAPAPLGKRYTVRLSPQLRAGMNHNQPVKL